MGTKNDAENTWDKLLNIKTIGRDDVKADRYRHPYEPTPYCVLERLANSELIRKGDVVLDYGCGKGRVSFFLSYQVKAKTVGIEYDERIYSDAVENSRTARTSAVFFCVRAEEFEIPKDVNRCYFFNPFSVEILHSVMARIIDSYYTFQREIFLFFYYPSDEYTTYLATINELEFYGEIDCSDLFNDKNARERIVIFRLIPM